MAPRNRIGEILLRARVIDELQLRSALAQLDQWGGRLSRTVAEMGLADEDSVVLAIAQGLGMPRVQLGNLGKDPSLLARMDASFCEQKGVFPVALRDNGKTLLLAMADPTDLQTVDQVAARTRLRVSVVVAGDQEIARAIRRLYRNQELTYSNIRERQEPSATDGDEFKIVDMSGKTVVKHINTLSPSSPTPPSPPVSSPPEASSAADLLEEIFSGEGPGRGLTEEALQRLEATRANQEKSTRILRALTELLAEKGVLSPKELAARRRG